MIWLTLGHEVSSSGLQESIKNKQKNFGLEKRSSAKPPLASYEAALESLNEIASSKNPRQKEQLMNCSVTGIR